MSAESAHLSTFGAETETEAEIRSTSIVMYVCCILYTIYNALELYTYMYYCIYTKLILSDS